MSSKVETMAYANDVPWHGLGVPVSTMLTPAEMMKASGTDWTVSKTPVMIQRKAGVEIVPNEFALIRDSDERVLSLVGSKYKPVQNAAVFEFFQEFCKAGDMTMETAGSLSDGQYLWALARVGRDFSVGNKKANDEVRPYLLIMSPHIRGKALTIQYTTVRVVCWNTLSMALGAGLLGDRTAFRMPHSQSWAVKKEEAQAALGLAIKHTEQFKEAASFLAKAKAAKELVDEFFIKVLKVSPDAVKTPIALPKYRAALERAPGAQLISAKGTWWGAVNAVTYVADHENSKNAQTALKNSWLGHQANVKRRALTLALEYAK